jgi:hypothetical protein
MHESPRKHADGRKDALRSGHSRPHTGWIRAVTRVEASAQLWIDDPYDLVETVEERPGASTVQATLTEGELTVARTAQFLLDDGEMHATVPRKLRPVLS